MFNSVFNNVFSVNVSFTTSEAGDCGRPEQPLGSLVTVEESGQVAVMSCQEGWLAGQEREDLRLTCNKARWEGSLPVCRGQF